MLNTLTILCFYSMAIQGAAHAPAKIAAFDVNGMREQIENYIRTDNSQALDKFLTEQALLNPKVVQEAINAPLQVDWDDVNHFTPLQAIVLKYLPQQYAFKNGIAIINSILNHGANIVLAPNDSFSPLHFLASHPFYNHTTGINTLLRGRQNLVDSPVDNNYFYFGDASNRGATPLMLAVDAMIRAEAESPSNTSIINNVLANARALLDNGADMTARYSDGTTVLARAQERSPRMYALLNEYYQAQKAGRKEAIRGSQFPKDPRELTEIIASY